MRVYFLLFEKIILLNNVLIFSQSVLFPFLQSSVALKNESISNQLLFIFYETSGKLGEFRKFISWIPCELGKKLFSAPLSSSEEQLIYDLPSD